MRTGFRILILIATLTWPATAWSQTATPAASTATAARLTALELQLKALLEQIEAVRQENQKSGSVDREPALPGSPAPPLPPPTAAPTSAATVAALEERVEGLDQQLRILERKLEIEREQATERAKTTPAVTAGREGFALRSADGAFQVRFRAYLQADGRFVGDRDLTNGPSTFVMRRVRPVFEATAFKIFDFRVMPDFGGGQTVLQDAYADARFAPWLRIRAGKYKAPFGLERLMSATELPFIERGAPTLIAPNRDLGVMVSGDTVGDRLSYSVGVFNGVVDGGSADIDERSGKDVVARLFVHPLRKSDSEAVKALGLGIAVSRGNHRGTLASPNLPQYRTTAQQTFFRYRSDLTVEGTTIADGENWRIGPQGYYYVGPFGLLSEFSISSQQVRRETTVGDARARGWQVVTSYALTGEAASYRGITPRHPFDRASNTWGAFELTARYGNFSVDDDVFATFANPLVSARQAHDWAGGVNWYLNRAIKITAEYEETHFDGGAPEGGDRPTERGVFTRLQFAF